MTLQDIVTKIADSIERQEGGRDAAGNIVPNTRAARNNNPGNIWDGLCPGKVQRIWPRYRIDSAGFVVFPNYATGRGAMERLAHKMTGYLKQIKVMCRRKNDQGYR